MSRSASAGGGRRLTVDPPAAGPTEDPVRPTTGAALFAREFLRAPLQTASLVPSSPALCAQLTAPVPETGDPVVVELGPGTGVVTDLVGRRLGRRGRQLVVELNPRFAAALAHRFPDVEVVCGDARSLPSLLAERGLRADVVISGLPWAAFRMDGAPPLPALVAATMTGGGAFVQIGYAATRRALPARRQLADLRMAFEEVTTTRTVWRNVPPAVVHLARRPRRLARLRAGSGVHAGATDASARPGRAATGLP